MDKIRYILLFALLCINSIYVYGAVVPRIIVLLLLTAFVLLSNKTRFYSLLPVTLISISFCFSFIIGYFQNPEMALSESKYLVFLYLYILVMTYMWDKETVFNFLFVISIIVNFAIIGMAIMFFMGINLDKQYLPESNFLVKDGSFVYSLTTLQSLSFFLAFNLIYFFNKRTIITLLPCLLGVVNVFINDRRALILFPVLVLVIYLLFIYKGKWKKDLIIFTPIVALLIVGILTYLTNLSGLDIGKQFSHAFELVAYDSESDDVRINQFSALMDKFMESPLLGNGIGAYAEGCIRNTEFRYAYELTYVAYLMKFGLVGFLFIFGSYIAMLIGIFKKNKEDYQFHSVFGGVLSLLLMNITNPYINVSLLIFITIVFVWNTKTIKVIKKNYEI